MSDIHNQREIDSLQSEIDRLRAENERLRAALERIAFGKYHWEADAQEEARAALGGDA